jgi:putative endonuclease
MPPQTPKTPTRRQSLGRWGEDRAVAQLIAAGFEIAVRNWRCRYGEIDIIAWDPCGTLCFIEVRTSRGTRFGGARSSVTREKRRRMTAIALLYLAEHNLNVPTRFDVMATQKQNEGWLTEHFQDAFPMESL